MRESPTAPEFQALPGTNVSDFFPIRKNLFFFFFFSVSLSLSQKGEKKQNKTKQTIQL
jgi:hypothetical protein